MPLCVRLVLGLVCLCARERVDARGKTRTCEQRDKTVFVLEKLGCVQALRENLLPFILNGIIFVRVAEKYDCRYAHAYWGLSTDIQKKEKERERARRKCGAKRKSGETKKKTWFHTHCWPSDGMAFHRFRTKGVRPSTRDGQRWQDIFVADCVRDTYVDTLLFFFSKHSMVGSVVGPMLYSTHMAPTCFVTYFPREFSFDWMNIHLRRCSHSPIHSFSLNHVTHSRAIACSVCVCVCVHGIESIVSEQQLLRAHAPECNTFHFGAFFSCSPCNWQLLQV